MLSSPSLSWVSNFLPVLRLAGPCPTVQHRTTTFSLRLDDIPLFLPSKFNENKPRCCVEPHTTLITSSSSNLVEFIIPPIVTTLIIIHSTHSKRYKGIPPYTDPSLQTMNERTQKTFTKTLGLYHCPVGPTSQTPSNASLNPQNPYLVHSRRVIHKNPLLSLNILLTSAPFTLPLAILSCPSLPLLTLPLPSNPLLAPLSILKPFHPSNSLSSLKPFSLSSLRSLSALLAANDVLVSSACSSSTVANSLSIFSLPFVTSSSSWVACFSRRWIWDVRSRTVRSTLRTERREVVCWEAWVSSSCSSCLEVQD